MDGNGQSRNDELTAKASKKMSVAEDDLAGKMKASGRSMVIFFGSQVRRPAGLVRVVCGM